MKKKELLAVLVRSADDLKISRERLDVGMIQQPGLYAFYGKWYNRAFADAKNAKLNLEKIEAKLFQNLGRWEDRATERKLTAYCRRNRAWLEARARLDEAAEVRNALEVVCKAMEHRRDMLINLSATVRSEMGSEISLKKER